MSVQYMRCGHCDSINMSTNATCTQCGAPGRRFIKLKISLPEPSQYTGNMNVAIGYQALISYTNSQIG